MIIAQGLQPSVTLPPIGPNPASRFGHCQQSRFQSSARGILNLFESDAANALLGGLCGDQDQRFAFSASPALSGPHATNESLINFDFTLQTISSWPNHGTPELMQPRPSRIITTKSQNAL